jgi:hypothetical protein
LGQCKEFVGEEFCYVEKWLRDNSPTNIPEEEALPDYTLGAQKGTTEEKLCLGNQTSMALETSTVSAIASSSQAEPPPYTFEHGPNL